MTETITPAPEYDAIIMALKYCDENDVTVPLDLRLRARRFTAVKAADLSGINKIYHDEITSNLITYFEGGSVTGPRNHFRIACSEAFYDAFYLGWKDGSGGGTPDSDGLEQLQARINQEFGHIDILFQQVKELRKDDEFDYFTFVTARADGYTSTVSAIYNLGVMLSKAGQLLTWVYGDTEHCATCNELNGQRHRASWYISRNYIPGQPGAAMECGGYRCKCHLEDSKGNVVTL